VILLTVDPSLTSLGYAITEFREEIPGQGLRVLHAGIVKNSSRDELSWAARISSTVHPIGYLTELLRFTAGEKGQHMAALIEQPETYAGVRGEKAALGGSLMILSAVGGAVFGAIRREISPGYPVRYVPVELWKGGVPKSVTQHRIQKRCLEGKLTGVTVEDLKSMANDAIDAIAIAYWAMEKGAFAKEITEPYTSELIEYL